MKLTAFHPGLSSSCSVPFRLQTQKPFHVSTNSKMISNTLHLLGYQWGKYGENPLWSMNDKASIYAWYHSSRRGRGVLWHLYHIAADTDDRNTNLMFYSPRQVLDSLFHHLHHKCQSKSVSLSEIHVPGGRVSVVLSWYTVVDRQNIQGVIELHDEENLFSATIRNRSWLYLRFKRRMSQNTIGPYRTASLHLSSSFLLSLHL